MSINRKYDNEAEMFEVHPVFHIAYKQALETTNLEYCESLRFYEAAKLQLNLAAEDSCLVPYDLRMEVPTEVGHTYLRRGMLLAREDVTAEVHENATSEDMSFPCARREMMKYEMSVDDAFRKAISAYALMRTLCMKEEAYAYFQLACYRWDCCLKLLESDDKKFDLPEVEGNILQRIKQYVLLAKKNWQEAMGFYGPDMPPSMYLNILLEISTLQPRFSSTLCSNAMMDSAQSCLLEGRHMLFKALSIEKTSPVGQPLHWPKDARKLGSFYKMSLQSSNLSDLHGMHSLWTA